jgi:phage terminase large subunit-like protein
MSTPIKIHPATNYAIEAVERKRNVGSMERLACLRHLRDLARAGQLPKDLATRVKKATGQPVPKKDPRFEWVFDGAQADLVAVEWFASLVHVKGRLAGKPIRLINSHRFEVSCIFGWVSRREKIERADGRSVGVRRFRKAFITEGRKNAKALALSTPLPTPDGWVRMADVKVGDKLFDERGQITRVIYTSDVMVGHTCYELTFSDGAKIVADAGHLWHTDMKKTHRPHSKRFTSTDFIHTTEEIARTLSVDTPFNKTHGRVEWNHRIRVAEPLTLPAKDLPINPYVLGCWLGDGHSNGARITIGYSDIQIVDEIAKTGVPIHETKSRSGNCGLFSLSTQEGARNDPTNSFGHKLSALNLRNNKHIPMPYLRASIEQRQTLLQGLNDTDGTISPAGQCSFSTSNALLAEGVIELLCSLGYKPTQSVGRALLYGKDCGTCFKIQFWAYQGQEVFRLERKRNRQKNAPATSTRASMRQIVAVNPIPSEPVRCIQVDSQSKLYLAGETMIPTHNTTRGAGIGLYMMVGDMEASPEVYCTAVDKRQARVLFNSSKEMAEQSRDIRARLKIGKFEINHKSRGGEMVAFSGEVKNKDAFSPSCAFVDEYHAHPTSEIYDQISSAKGQRAQPLMLIITTAGMDVESPCHHEYEYAKMILKGQVKNERYFVMIRELDEGDDEHDPKNWTKANPLMMSNRVMRKELRDMHDEAFNSKDSAKIRTFRVKNLNIWVHGNESTYMGEYLTPALGESLSKWDQCGVPREEFLELTSGRLTLVGLDLSKKIDLTAAGSVFLLEDERVAVCAHGFIPEGGVDRHEKLDKIPYRDWARDGWLTITEGDVTDYRRVQEYIQRCEKEYLWKTHEIAYDPYAATHFAIELSELGYITVEIAQWMKILSEPTKTFRELVASGKLVHDNSPLLRWAVGNAREIVDTKENIMLSKKKAGDTRRIDPIAAIITAMVRMQSLKESDMSGILDQDWGM